MALVDSYIGLDFGNWFSQIGFFQNIDKDTRRGGNYIDLTDISSLNAYGTPSAFFFAKRYGDVPLIGQSAVNALPKSNCHRMLKRKMNDGKVTIDGREFSYGEMITAVVQHIMRLAEAQLKKRQLPVTSKVCLAYPVSFSYSERLQLIELVEKATLSDEKTHIKVVGTISEPAAAALDYLATVSFTSPTEVLVYDLGGGTFDVARVKAYPTLQKLADGGNYYYDILFQDGLERLGGNEFDAALKAILLRKAGAFASDKRTEMDIDSNLENIKKTLSRESVADPNILLPDGTYMDMVTREEFENATKNLIEQTIKMVRDALDPKHGNGQPSCIVLTGGASEMPMVKEALENALPQFKGKIHSHLPSKSISMGAARFGIVESNREPDIPIIQRTIHDIGICYTNKQTKKDYIKTFIPAGTIIPTHSAEIRGEALTETDYLSFRIHEATKTSPDKNNTKTDYTEICTLTYDNHCTVQPGHQYLSKIEIDAKNLLTLTVWEPDVPSHKPQTANCNVSRNIK